MNKMFVVNVTIRRECENYVAFYPCDSEDTAKKLKARLSEMYLKWAGLDRLDFEKENFQYDLKEDEKNFAVTAFYDVDDFIIEINDVYVVDGEGVSDTAKGVISMFNSL